MTLVPREPPGTGGPGARAPGGTAKAPPAAAPIGLSSAEAAERLVRFGANEVEERAPSALAVFLRKLWSPVPWMLEASILLELTLGHRTQAVIIALLLVMNAALSFLQEDRARRAIELLRQRLTVRARVLRDGGWKAISARELVPGDVVRVRMGDVTPADCRVLEGQLLEDRSVITGESLPQEVAAGGAVYAGTTLRRGEATAEVVHTGAATRFGKTAELVQRARPTGHVEALVLRIVRVLVALDVLVAAVIVLRAWTSGLPPTEIVPFLLMLLVASVPVALPATFTLATALGARELAAAHVLVAKLQAIEAAASMDVLCCDKTGTITENRLSVVRLVPFSPFGESELLRLAALASDRATQDPIDLAIFDALDARGLHADERRTHFEPFDTSTKRSEAQIETAAGSLRVAKGAPQVVAGLALPEPRLGDALHSAGAGGDRVLAVASGSPGALALAGLVGLADSPRRDSKEIVERIRALGVRILMLTGDSLATARAVAGQVGLEGDAHSAEDLRSGAVDLSRASLVAEVFPEDKFAIVRGLQGGGRVVGMTGDGVNDAPALRQADVGVAVSAATDVARAAAGFVLVDEGLSGILHVLEIGRQVYQRLLTYTLNKIVKTLQTVLFLGGWFLFDGTMAVTPRLIVLLLFANDFVTMSLATDRVFPSRRPERWDVRALSFAGLLLGTFWVAFGVALLLVARRLWHFDLPRLQTLSFLMLVFTGQGTVYLIRGRNRFLGRAPSRWLAGSSLWALGATSLLALQGWWMASLPLAVIAELAGAVLVATALADGAKVLGLRWVDRARGVSR
ncbi:MAG TPA: HAD-IC family P-type ATPase [Myxococcales bacterium]|nr:HAD-IC family P-type ATPase [Myxococcales bacterium]